MRLNRTLVLLLVIAGVVAGTARAWGGRPATPPPRPAQTSGPPPVWIESRTRSAWLDYDSYCWKTACADYLPPLQRPGLRTLRTSVGAQLRIHFPFRPTAVTAQVLPAKRPVRLSASRTATYRVRALGILAISVKAASGSAAYLIKLSR